MTRGILLFLILLPSCSLFPRSTPSPVPSAEAGKPDGREWVVFLPGRWSHIEEFEKEGFFRIAAARWPEARLIAPDLHVGYYRDRSIARRLHDDIIAPARRAGARHIRLVGISMGGLGALIHELEYPGSVDELILLSPYLGETAALREIEAAGGLSRWNPRPIAEDDFTRKLWKGLAARRVSPHPLPPILLGCGESDRLAASNRLFAREFLPPEKQLWIAGSHDWPTWRHLLTHLPLSHPAHTRKTPRNPLAP